MDRAGATSPLSISLAVHCEAGGGWPQNRRTAAIETVFLFARVRVPGRTRPLLLLRDFTRIALRAGETRRVSFDVTHDWLTREGLAPAPADVSFLEIIVAASAEPEADPARCLRRVLVARKGADHGRATG